MTHGELEVISWYVIDKIKQAKINLIKVLPAFMLLFACPAQGCKSSQPPHPWGYCVLQLPKIFGVRKSKNRPVFKNYIS